MADRTCSVDGCAKAHYSKTYCNAHYQRWRRYGDPLGERIYPETYCKVEGCGRRAAGWELCDSHYRRWKRTGDPRPSDPLVTQYVDAEEAFAARTRRDPDSGCLIWDGVRVQGYGQIVVEGKKTVAHRYAWERTNGPIADEALIDHKCWNKACVNVEHLRIATNGENSRYLSGPTSTSSTGVRNVFRAGGKYRVRVVRDGVRHNGGHFTDISEAANAAERLRLELFGDFAGRG